MKRSDRIHLAVSAVYAMLLTMALVGFLLEPNPMVYPNWNGLAVSLGPIAGTPVVILITLIQMARRKISLGTGLVAIVVLLAISFLCLALTWPIMMGI